jgi:hypothetical protein
MARPAHREDQEVIMRRILVAAGLVLTAFSSAVLADGPIVRWDRVEGVIGADYMPVQVGPFPASGRWRTTGSGQVVLNLKTGFLSVKVSGISVANHYANGPLGSPTPLSKGNVIVTVVCNSTERYGPITWADATVPGGVGSLNWHGFLDLPTACVDNPEELVFLVRHIEGPPFYGSFMLYGAERTIR